MGSLMAGSSSRSTTILPTSPALTTPPSISLPTRSLCCYSCSCGRAAASERTLTMISFLPVAGSICRRMVISAIESSLLGASLCGCRLSGILPLRICPEPLQERLSHRTRRVCSACHCSSVRRPPLQAASRPHRGPLWFLAESFLAKPFTVR